MTGAPKLGNESRDPDHAYLEDSYQLVTMLILHTVNSYTKFEVSSFSRSRDISGMQTHVRHMTLITPISGIFIIGRLELHTVNMCTKFEIAILSAIYEDINGDAKCSLWFVVIKGQGHLRSWAMSTFDRTHTTSYSTSIETTLCICLVPFSR